MTPQKRLFVPLAKEPFEWFESGQKHWEVRKAERGFAPQHVQIGRVVELHLGYSTPEAIWAEITEVVLADTLEELYERVPFSEVIPVAASVEEATRITTEILRLNLRQSQPLVAFRVVRRRVG